MRSIPCKQLAVLIAVFALASCAAVQPAPSMSTSSLGPQLATNLNCQDAWSGNTVSDVDAPRAEGVSSLAWAGSPAGYSWPIRDDMHGYPYTGNGGQEYGGWKTPITMDAGSGERTISIESPSHAALIIASAAEWETGDALREGQLGLPTSYTVTGCADRASSFPGITLVQGPACVVIRVTDTATAKSSTVSVPMYGGHCP